MFSASSKRSSLARISAAFLAMPRISLAFCSLFAPATPPSSLKAREQALGRERVGAALQERLRGVPVEADLLVALAGFAVKFSARSNISPATENLPAAK